MSVSLISSVAIGQDSPKVQVQVTDLMGTQIGPLKLTAVSAKEMSNGNSILNNEAFSVTKQGANTVYEFDIMALKPKRGFYEMVLNAEGGNAKLVGNKGATLTFKVLSTVNLLEVEAGTVDADQSVAPNLKK